MSEENIARYVVTLRYEGGNLNDLNNLTSVFTLAHYSTRMTDDDGKTWELGTNSFGITSGQDAETLRSHAAGLAESALHREVQVEVQPWERWLQKCPPEGLVMG
ncbi:type V toxin-antitoxin system endoribonuclease antitoxin GhoS [Pantoea sp. 1.19]|uniref:type V toxin-antitoxin system endoribonuclease antitoxin GhoS n=1 Tax=Pantoea sp. 1.19 TaxID=1925589 RepID=UPI000949107F|nr:type V toxin-antitoxin system endoribonuclease antitoxin GhoS [Pantoea sp. 1.19]